MTFIFVLCCRWRFNHRCNPRVGVKNLERVNQVVVDSVVVHEDVGPSDLTELFLYHASRKPILLKLE